MPVERTYRNSAALVIAATGIRQRLNLPVKEFFSRAGLLDKSRIVLKDPTKRLALGGLSPEYPSFADLVDGLKAEVLRYSPNPLLTVGTSGGGFTALLLGHLLRADYAVVFNAYTYVDPDTAAKKGDPSIERINNKRGFFEDISGYIRRLTDLKTTISDWNGRTKYYLHTSRFNTWDYRRACHSNGTPMTTVIPHAYERHNLAVPLARNKRLRECFELPYPTSLYMTTKLECKIHKYPKNAKKLIKDIIINTPLSI